MTDDRSAEANHWTVIVRPSSAQFDSHARDMLADVHYLGLHHIQNVQSSRVYLLAGKLNEAEVKALAAQLLSDPVVESFSCTLGFSNRDEAVAIEVHPLPGVMNPPAQSALEAGRRAFAGKGKNAVACLDRVETARRYEISGAKSIGDLEKIASKVLANDCVETWYLQGFGRRDPLPDNFPTPPSRPFAIRTVKLHGLSDDDLLRLSRQAHLFLSLREMSTIRDHFQSLGRDPTDLELETLAQTWSEHCVHKTLKSEIEYTGEDFGQAGEVSVHFDNLLKDTIAAATYKLEREWCLSVFVDNAGVIAFNDDFGIAFKVETHNHPSAIEPYGGAATGVGGCIRDIMGCGLGAKPIASTDVFCLAPPDFKEQRVPAGVLHPRRVLKGVVSGVRDYGNRMGIPTVNGAVHFNEKYLANPLVFCGCVGLIPRNRIKKAARIGDLIVVAGGRTGRDGIHGATFSSAELTDQHADEFSHAVQIGNAIEEKKLLDAMLIARDHPGGCLYSAVTDCGAGGLSSAIGEMGAELGVVVDLEKVPLKYTGLRYDEIWISEAQERMVFAVPRENIEKFLAAFTNEEVEATVIGEFTADRNLTARYNSTVVGELQMHFLHEGLPRISRVATWSAEKNIAPRPDHITDLKTHLLQTLASLNVASKEWIIRQYDHEVQGRSVIKPLVGPGFGPSDAAVLRPLHDGHRGIALACGLCPELGEIDPYWMAVHAVDEALRNVICVGADPMHVAILDNFCWPKADSERSLGALVRTCRGAHDAAMAYGLPFISGKDSLNNEFSMSADEAKRTGLPRQLSIPPTLLISAVGILDDVRRCVSMDFKEPGNVIVLAYPAHSKPSPELNEDAQLKQKSFAELPHHLSIDLAAAVNVHHHVSNLIRSGDVRAAHDVSDGGLAVAIAEMCIAGEIGADVDLGDIQLPGSIFNPLGAAYVLEMDGETALRTGYPIIGRVSREPRLKLSAGDLGDVALPVDELARAWRTPLVQEGASKQ